MLRACAAVGLACALWGKAASGAAPGAGGGGSVAQVRLAAQEGWAGPELVVPDALVGLTPGQRAAVSARVLAQVDGRPAYSAFGRPWKHRADTYLVALRSGTKPELAAAEPTLLAFELRGDSIRQIAVCPGRVALGADESVIGFDTAPYRLTESEYAFGLRFRRDRGYSGGSAVLEGIILFQIRDGRIEEVLRTWLQYSADLAGVWGQDGHRARSEHHGHAVLAVAEHRTLGHFDLLKRGDERATFRWSGTQYVAEVRVAPAEDLDILDFRPRVPAEPPVRFDGMPSFDR